jgi:hypothetical protein
VDGKDILLFALGIAAGYYALAHFRKTGQAA